MAAFNLEKLLGPKRYTATTQWTVSHAVLASVAIVIYAYAMGIAAYLLGGVIVGLPERGSDLSNYAWGVLLVMQIAVATLIFAVASMGGGQPGEQGNSSIVGRKVLALQRASESGSSNRIRPYILAFAGFVICAGLYEGIAWLIWPKDYLKDLLEFRNAAHSNQIWLFFLVAAIGAPLSEEFLFRGFLLPALAQTRIGFAGAAVVTSALWTVPHWGYSAITLGEAFLMGLFLSAVLWRTGSLWVTIVCHGLYNLALILILLAIGPAS